MHVFQRGDDMIMLFRLDPSTTAVPKSFGPLRDLGGVDISPGSLSPSVQERLDRDGWAAVVGGDAEKVWRAAGLIPSANTSDPKPIQQLLADF